MKTRNRLSVALVLMTLPALASAAAAARSPVDAKSLVNRVTDLEGAVQAQAQQIESLSEEFRSAIKKPHRHYVGGSLKEFGEYLKGLGLRLEVGSRVTDEQIRSRHALIEACFDAIQRDFPVSQFPKADLSRIQKVILTNEVSDGIAVIIWAHTNPSRMELGGSATTQGCYNRVYSELIGD